MSVLEARTAVGGKQLVEFIFPRGIPGLDTYRRFLVEPVPENRLFAMLISVEDPSLGLILVDPMPFFPGYGVDLLETDRRDLRLKREEDMVVFTTVTVEDNGLCTNLAAPVLVNVVEKRGKQIILAARTDQMRVPLMVTVGKMEA